jgi:soluble lytic murein transglycosylase
MMAAMQSKVFAVLLLAMIACNLPAAPAPTVIPTSTPVPTATQTPTPIPTPEPVSRLDAAHRAVFVGDWDRAIEEFDRGLATTEDTSLIKQATLGLGIAHALAGHSEQAILQFDRYIESFPDSDQLANAYFWRARVRSDLESSKDFVIADYLSYLNLRPGVIDSYVMEWMGDAHRLSGFPLDALDAYELAREAPRVGGSAPVEVKIGRAYLMAGRFDDAIRVFDDLYQVLPDAFSRATLNLLMGQAHTELGDFESAYERYLDSVANYPEAYNTYLGLIELVNAGVAVDEIQRGVIDFNAGAYEPALAAFDRALAVEGTSVGFYYRALTKRALGDSFGALQDLEVAVNQFPSDSNWSTAVHEKAITEWAYLDDYDAAVNTYVLAVQAQPESSFAPKILFDAGRVAERSGDLDLAAELWSQAANDYSQSAFAYQSAFEAGIVNYRKADFLAAQGSFQFARDLARNASEIAANGLWLGKSLHAQGLSDQANLAWEQGAAADPTGYYSVRSGHLLAGQGPFESVGLFDFDYDEMAEREEAESWLRITFGIPTDRSLQDLGSILANDGQLLRGDELWRLGLFDEARSEYESLREQKNGDAEALYRLMNHFVDKGVYRQAILASRRVLALAGMDDAATMSAPIYFNRVRFGPYFADLILPEALRAGLDGLLVTSVVRQESLFAANAVSSAAARGLMQIIPSTGQAIATELLWPADYHEDDLYRPIVSVRFGTHYLAEQRDRFDGDIFAALAAYNAGPGNSFVWKGLAPEDPDLYLEVVRFTQTHTYIRTIFEVFDIYQRLYVQP